MTEMTFSSSSQLNFTSQSVIMRFQQILNIAVTLSLVLVLAVNLARPVSGHIHLEVPENVRKMAFILHEHCVAETGIDEDWTIQMLRGKLPEDRNFGCYLHCIFDTVGLVSTEGHIRFEDIMHLLPMRHQEVIGEVVKACNTVCKWILGICSLAFIVLIHLPLFQSETMPVRPLILPSSASLIMPPPKSF